MTSKRYFSLIIILGTLSAIGPFSIDMYLPGFPAIADNLNTTVAHVALSLSSFFIGISAGQLLYGPLLDRFGRKKPLYFGLSLFILASLGCALVNTADMLVVLRFFQAVGGCAGMVAARAMVRDLFPVEENAKVFSLLMLVIGVSPMIAPATGGYVAAVFGWQYIFIILAVIGALILTGVHFILPESRQPDNTFSLRPRMVIKNFYGVFTNPQFYTYAITGSMAGGGLYAYISGSPFVFMELNKLSGQQYGWIFAVNAFGLIGSSQMNSLLLKKGYKSEQIVVGALICQSLAGICLLAATISGNLTLFSTLGIIFIFLCCQGYVFPNASALSLAPFSKNAGSASALLGGLQMGIGALASASVSWLSNNTALPMATVMAGCAVTSLCILMIGQRMIRYRSSEEVLNQMAKT